MITTLEKKLGNLFTSLTTTFQSMWTPRQHISIDEGCIPFKGRESFKCFNHSKSAKYHIETFKVVDSSNNYCLNVDLYVGNAYEEKITEFGVTHDLVIRMLDGFLKKSYIVYMDNYYTSPFLFYNLRLAQTGAVGTCRP